MADEENREIIAGQGPVIENPWRALRQHTPARIGLGRTGHSLPTQAHLEFQLAHARARDAVYTEFDPALLAEQLAERGLESLTVHSRAEGRLAYLKNPDSGRRLDAASVNFLQERASDGKSYDALFVLADGLSAQAAQSHALPLLAAVYPELAKYGWRIAPVVIAGMSRVALGDEIGELLRAEQVAILIGERPGLSAPDSLGVYLTFEPKVGRLESERNCISNIRPEGLQYGEAAATLLYLMNEARRRRLSGIRLKDDRDPGQKILP